MVVSDRWAGSDRNFYSRNCKCIGIFWKKGKYQCDSGRKYLVDAKGQTRADRTATVTKITIHYNQGIQKSITWAQQNGITDNWKGDAWGDVSNFSYNNQIVGRESGVKKKTTTWNCASGWWWWCNGVGDIFLTHCGTLSRCTHLLTPGDRHVTKLRSSQMAFLNLLLWFDVLHSHMILIQKS